jgi:hypothetical protein
MSLPNFGPIHTFLCPVKLIKTRPLSGLCPLSGVHVGLVTLSSMCTVPTLSPVGTVFPPFGVLCGCVPCDLVPLLSMSSVLGRFHPSWLNPPACRPWVVHFGPAPGGGLFHAASVTLGGSHGLPCDLPPVGSFQVGRTLGTGPLC